MGQLASGEERQSLPGDARSEMPRRCLSAETEPRVQGRGWAAGTKAGIDCADTALTAVGLRRARCNRTGGEDGGGERRKEQSEEKRGNKRREGRTLSCTGLLCAHPADLACPTLAPAPESRVVPPVWSG